MTENSAGKVHQRFVLDVPIYLFNISWLGNRLDARPPMQNLRTLQGSLIFASLSFSQSKYEVYMVYFQIAIKAKEARFIFWLTNAILSRSFCVSLTKAACRKAAERGIWTVVLRLPCATAFGTPELNLSPVDAGGKTSDKSAYPGVLTFSRIDSGVRFWNINHL